MKTAIVSGANGFIGSALVRELLSNDYKVYALCRESSCANIPHADRIEIIFCDLCEIQQLERMIPQNPYTCFYHLAWKGVADSSRDCPELQIKNVQWTINALRAAKKIGCRRFVGAGSIMEYEALAGMRAQESCPGRGDIYGGAKVLAHIMCKALAAQVGIELLWAEVTNAYGPGEKSPRLVNSTIRKCLRGEAPEFTAGTQNYDFVYIDDVARAFRLIGEKGRPFHKYTIGSSMARPLKDFLLEMQKAVAPDLPFKLGSVPFTGVNLPLTEFNCSDTERDTGFRAEVDFKEGCKLTAEWIKREKGIERF